MVQFAGAICAALFLQLMFGDVSAGGNYPIAKPGGDWRSLVMETVLTAILVSVILNTATGARSHRPQRRHRRRVHGSPGTLDVPGDRKSTRLNSSHLVISYAVFCLKKKKHER